jgi:hypothetical protein
MSSVSRVQIQQPYDETKHTGGGLENEPFLLFAISTIFWPISFARMFPKGRFLLFLGATPLAIYTYLNDFYIQTGAYVTIVAFFVWFFRFLKNTTI